MYELFYKEERAEGSPYLSGYTLLEACQRALDEHMCVYEGWDPPVALLPGATKEPGVYALLLFRQGGTIEDTGYRLHESEG